MWDRGEEMHLRHLARPLPHQSLYQLIWFRRLKRIPPLLPSPANSRRKWWRVSCKNRGEKREVECIAEPRFSREIRETRASFLSRGRKVVLSLLPKLREKYSMRESRQIHLCFFLTSAKMRTSSASIRLLYLNRVPALASIKPSSATWEKTKPSALINWKPAALATAIASSLHPARIYVRAREVERQEYSVIVRDSMSSLRWHSFSATQHDTVVHSYRSFDDLCGQTFLIYVPEHRTRRFATPLS